MFKALSYRFLFHIRFILVLLFLGHVTEDLHVEFHVGDDQNGVADNADEETRPLESVAMSNLAVQRK